MQECRLLQKKKIAKQVQTQTSFVPNEFPISHNNTVIPVSGKKKMKDPFSSPHVTAPRMAQGKSGKMLREENGASNQDTQILQK